MVCSAPMFKTWLRPWHKGCGIYYKGEIKITYCSTFSLTQRFCTTSENRIKVSLEAVAGVGFPLYDNSETWNSIMESNCTRAVCRRMMTATVLNSSICTGVSLTLWAMKNPLWDMSLPTPLSLHPPLKQLGTLCHILVCILCVCYA